MTDTQIVEFNPDDPNSLYERAVELKNITGQNFLELGAILGEIRDSEHWKTIHGGYDTWESFLMASDLKYDVKTANFFINVYRTFIIKLGFTVDKIAKIPQNRLNAITAKVKDVTPEQANELVEQAETLSYSDFRKNMEEQGIMKPRKVVFHHCKTCDKLQVEYNDDEMCHCDGTLHIKSMENTV